MEFSAAVLRMDWNWENVKGILAEAKNRKIYIICQDFGDEGKRGSVMNRVRKAAGKNGKN